MSKKIENNPKVLGLDVSTKTIGWALFDITTKQLLELTHISPQPKPKKENKMEELLVKAEMFRTKLSNYQGLGITHVVIEEPLLNSNNVYTISTLLRYNTLIFKEVYDVLGVVPEFISTYNSRKFAFPHLIQPNDKGKHVLYPQITWQYTRNSTLKKENFDQTDAYTCALGFMKQQEIW